MVSLKVNFQKKDLWLVVAIVVFLVGVGYVISFGDYTGNEAQISGHSSNEVMVKNKTGSLVTLQELVDQGGVGGGSTLTYSSCTYIDIYSQLCNGVPGCSFSSGRLTLIMPAPWVVVGGNYNSPEYVDGLYVCKVNIQ